MTVAAMMLETSPFPTHTPKKAPARTATITLSLSRDGRAAIRLAVAADTIARTTNTNIGTQTFADPWGCCELTFPVATSTPSRMKIMVNQTPRATNTEAKTRFENLSRSIVVTFKVSSLRKLGTLSNDTVITGRFDQAVPNDLTQLNRLLDHT